MKRIYETYSYRKELVGYQYNGYYIAIEKELRNSMWGTFKKWYHIVLKNGQKICYDRLCDAKERINEDIK